ncbi:hypothetical protein CPB84DRAFT_776640 [Gymnopilus junonius]|uniref:Cyanovirin-N domain-containing protein n=1 Tax=Gymnopilus junonius TaxID=109634 RepID=A0A9P5N776_GYMJU|nr:hypothetical protein CPB84DRAFT_776640 [Gymnopilus junonius]
MVSAASSTSMTTSVSTSSVTKSSSSSSYFSSSKFRSSSKLLLIEETCTKLGLKGTVLHAECQRLDGSTTDAHIDLDEIIGFVNGQLLWDHKGFSKLCFEYSLHNFFLVVKYRTHAGEQPHTASIDLRIRLRNQDGALILVELNQKLSVMLSEVPWMKFKVIAEPDLSVFAQHPVMKETLTRIAETTVEHVTIAMHEQLTIAMEAAIAVVTKSAMHHVSEQIQTLVAGVTGYGASASPSITAAEHLRLFGAGAFANLQAHGYEVNEHNYNFNGAFYSAPVSHIDGHGHHLSRDEHSYAAIAKHAQVAHT